MNDQNPITFFTVGELAKRFGVSSQSIRNWEQYEDIPAATRTVGGHRRYTQEHVNAIREMMKPRPPSRPTSAPHA